MTNKIQLQDILQIIRQNNSEVNLDLISEAWDFSQSLYGDSDQRGQVSGHLLAVTAILAQFKVDASTCLAGILHHCVLTDREDLLSLRRRFGAEVAELVEGVCKVERLSFKGQKDDQAENFRKMLMALARDIRVILIKLADQVQDMRTIDSQPREDQLRIAKETRHIYAPLANRLGMSWVKSELEDLSFRVLEPEDYRDLQERVSRGLQQREAHVQLVKQEISRFLERQQIHGEVSGRAKHLYSLHKKIKRQGVDLDQIYDLIAFRVLVDSVRDCYAVLGLIHAAWKPVSGRFKDYIAMPKANMYQSLHTTVIGPKGERMEVQIRTFEMHRVAEEGIAAHWKYKEGAAASESQDDQVRHLRKLQQELQDAGEFADNLAVDLFPESVYVFTPHGEVKELARGACTIDFAFAVHSDVGLHCTGARINGKLVPLKTRLQNGDVVEIITSPGQTPSKDWLNFVETTRAKNRIRQWIKAQEWQRSLELGRELLERALRKYGMSLKKALASGEMNEAVTAFGMRSAEDILVAVGYGKLSCGQLLSHLVPQEQLKAEEPKKSPFGRVLQKFRKKKSSDGIRIQGIDDIMVRFAKCCNPLPGDDVVGFITRGTGVTVHMADCPQVQESDPLRRLDVSWDMGKKTSRPIKIRIVCSDQKGMLASITTAITESEANIVSANVMARDGRKGENTFEIDVQDLDHLNRVFHALRRIKGVQTVDRLKE